MWVGNLTQVSATNLLSNLNLKYTRKIWKTTRKLYVSLKWLIFYSWLRIKQIVGCFDSIVLIRITDILLQAVGDRYLNIIWIA